MNRLSDRKQLRKSVIAGALSVVMLITLCTPVYADEPLPETEAVTDVETGLNDAEAVTDPATDAEEGLYLSGSVNASDLETGEVYTLSADTSVNIDADADIGSIDLSGFNVTFTGDDSHTLLITGDADQALNSIYGSGGSITLNGGNVLTQSGIFFDPETPGGDITVNGGSLASLSGGASDPFDDYAIYTKGSLTVNGGSLSAAAYTGAIEDLVLDELIFAQDAGSGNNVPLIVCGAGALAEGTAIIMPEGGTFAGSDGSYTIQDADGNAAGAVYIGPADEITADEQAEDEINADENVADDTSAEETGAAEDAPDDEAEAVEEENVTDTVPAEEENVTDTAPAEEENAVDTAKNKGPALLEEQSSRYPTGAELFFGFQSVSDVSWQTYYMRTALDGLQGNTVPEADLSRLGGIRYDESTGVLTISGEGADDYVWWSSISNKWQHSDLRGELKRIYIKTADPDRVLNLTINFEVDTTLADSNTRSYTASDWARIPEVSSIIENTTGGSTTLTSTNGSRVRIERSVSGSGNYLPVGGICSEGPVNIGGNIELDLHSQNTRSGANQYACGIWSNSVVMITSNAKADISAFSNNTILDSTCVTSAVRCNSTVYSEPFEIFTDHPVTLSGYAKSSADRGAAIYDANSTNSLSWHLSSGCPRVVFEYYGGSFGLTGNNTTADAEQKTGYVLSDATDEEGTKIGVRYLANNGQNLDRAIVSVTMPQIGKKMDETATVTPYSAGFTVANDGIGNNNILWHYRMSASDEWRNVTTNNMIPLGVYEMKVRYKIEAKDNYYFFDSLKGGYVGEGKVGAPEEINVNGSKHWAIFERIIPASKLRTPELITQVDITGVTEPVPGGHPNKPVPITDPRMSAQNNRIPSGAKYIWAYFRPDSGGQNTYPNREWWTVKGSSTPLNQSYTFEAGTIYTYHAILCADLNSNVQYAFAGYPYGGTLAGTVNGSDLDLTTYQNGVTVGGYVPGQLAVVTRDFKCPDTLIDRVEITNLTLPVKGAQPNADAKPTAADASSKPYHITEQGWYYQSISNPVLYTFRQATEYSWIGYIKPAEGFRFSDNDTEHRIQSVDLTTYINGVEVLPTIWYIPTTSSAHPGEIRVEMPYFTPGSHEVSRIDITTDAFGPGLTPGTSASTDTPGVSVASGLGLNHPEGMEEIVGNSAFWLEGADPFPYMRDSSSIGVHTDSNPLYILYDGASASNPVHMATSFEAGKAYTFYVSLDADDDTFFDYDQNKHLLTEVYINGYPAYFPLLPEFLDKNPALISGEGSSVPTHSWGIAAITVEFPEDGKHSLWVPSRCKVYESGRNQPLDEGYESTAWIGSAVSVRYSIDPTKTYTVRLGDWQPQKYRAFWKWEKTAGNIEIEYPMRNWFTFKGSDVTEDIAVRIQDAHYLYVPKDFSDKNYAIKINGWDNSWNNETSSSIGSAYYDGGIKKIFPHEIVDNNSTPDDTSDDYTLIEGKDYTVSYKDSGGNPVENPKDAGRYTIVLTGIGAYDGTRDKGTYEIYKTNIAKAEATFDTFYDYSGSSPTAWVYWADDPDDPGTSLPQKPSFTVKYNGRTLVEGVDYEEVQDSDWSGNYNVTTNARVRIRGKGNFDGSKDCYFQIRTHDIADAEIEALPDVLYTGQSHRPEPVVKFGDRTLVKDTHYYIYTYKNNYDVSTGETKAEVILRGYPTRGWSGEHKVYFKILPVDIGDEDLVTWEVEPQEYTASVISPDVSGTYNGRSLYKTSDYTVTSTVNARDPGTGTITIEGTGNYTGTKELDFEIYADLGKSYVDYSGVEGNYDYTGSAIRPEPVVKLGTNTLKKDVDYKLEYGENTDYGSGWVEVTPVNTKLYRGSKTLSFNIKKVDVGTATVETIPAQLYTGEEIKPEPVVKVNGRTLIKDTDYNLTYSSNNNVGTGYVTIYGIGNYYGYKQVTFEIKEMSMEVTDIDPIPDQKYTGKQIKPKPVVRYKGTVLTENVDYTLSYGTNILGGTGTVTVTGIDPYKDSKTVEFRILGYSLMDAEIAPIGGQTYTGEALTPKIKVTHSGKTLKEGTDYTVTYSKNKKPGVATVKATGKGAYYDSANSTFIVCFKDVPLTHSFQKHVYWAVDKGIAAGYSAPKDGIFGVRDDITRGQVVMFLWRAAGKPAPAKNTQTFKDVPTTHAFYKAIQWAVEQHITGGYTGARAGYFGPNDNCTRGQIATFLWRYAGRPEPVENTQTFSDVPTKHSFYKAIQWAAEQGITTGYKDGRFGVNDTCTRGQCVTFLHRQLG